MIFITERVWIKFYPHPFCYSWIALKRAFPPVPDTKKYRRPQSLNSSCVLYSSRSQFPPLTMITYEKSIHVVERALVLNYNFSSASTNIMRNVSTPKASSFVKTTSLNISKHRILHHFNSI